MLKQKSKTRKYLFLSTAVAAVGLGVYSFGAIFPKSTEYGIKLDNFPEGTEVTYEISSQEGILENGKIYLGQEGLNLPLPNEDSSDETSSAQYQYQLTLNAPQSADAENFSKTVDLLLNLNTDTGAVDFQAQGLKDYSNIVIYKGDEYEEMSADWSGMFSEKGVNISRDQDDTVIHDTLELAFDNAMRGMDFDPMNGGRVEVFFGDSDAADRNDVRVRYSSAFQQMAKGLSLIMFKQTMMIGTFIDAKMQLTTQRKWQELSAQAHKDYQPSEQMCRFGTFIRSVAQTEAKAEVNKLAMNRMLMDRYLAVLNSAASQGPGSDLNMRKKIFVEHHCDPFGNDGAPRSVCDVLKADGSVDYKLEEKEITRDRQMHLNRDIDYQTTLLSPLTIDVDFDDGALQQLAASDATAAAKNEHTSDERDIIALASNLYFPRSLKNMSAEQMYTSVTSHYDSRSLASKMSVAHNSFVNILGMKASAPKGDATPTVISSETPQKPRMHWIDTDGDGIADADGYQAGSESLDEDTGWAYMKALLREFDISDSYDTLPGGGLKLDEGGYAINDIDRILGKRPSYYAQMEVLTKKIYQTPDFYTNLYDKPQNVQRIGVSMDAIEVMNQRDRFDSMLRREMLTSVLLEEEIQSRANQVNARLYELMKEAQDKY